MPSQLSLTPDELLTTTRAVRKRLDFSRPVERSLIEECLQIAIQAPTGSNRQDWQWLVVTDPAKRAAIGELYRRGWYGYNAQRQPVAELYPGDEARQRTQTRVVSSAQFLADHMHEAPVLVIPCIAGRTEGASVVAQAGKWGSILPAVWSFMLAARARGLGTCWTTLHLPYEEEAARILGIPYAEYMQTALTPVAYTKGTDFKAGPREPLETVVHWNAW